MKWMALCEIFLSIFATFESPLARSASFDGPGLTVDSRLKVPAIKGFGGLDFFLHCTTD